MSIFKSSTRQSPSEAVLRARELILVALENADSTALEHLISLQELIKNLSFVRLLEEAKKKEAGEGR